MKINQPAFFDFADHYKGDGLKSFDIKLKFKTGTPVDLTDAVVRMQLRTLYSRKSAFEFSSLGDGEALLTIDAVEGVISFPTLPTWEIPSYVYDYDLQVEHASGFVATYLKGKWKVNQDITKNK